jgi:acetylglutamate kinase
MKQPLHIIKIGGNVIDNPEKLSAFLREFSGIKEPKILIHGGGKNSNRVSGKMDIPQQMIDGRRVTDAETLKLITMVYGGLISKNIVAALSANGDTAIGLSEQMLIVYWLIKDLLIL